MREKYRVNLNDVLMAGLLIGILLLMFIGRQNGSGSIGAFFVFFSLPALLLCLGAMALRQPFAAFIKQRLKQEQAYFALKIFRILLFLSSIFHALLAAALFFAAPYIAKYLLKVPLFSMPLRFAGIGLLFLSISYLIAGFLQGMGLINYVKHGFLILWLVSFPAAFFTQSAFAPYGEKVAVFMRNPDYTDMYRTAGMEAGAFAGILISFLYFVVVLLLVLRRNEAYFDDLPRQDVPAGNFFISIPSQMLTAFFRYGFFFLDILLLCALEEVSYGALGETLLGGFLPVDFAAFLF